MFCQTFCSSSIFIILFLFFFSTYGQNISTINELFKLQIYDDQISQIPKLNILLNETTVSGFSSGAFFASQFAVAHSSFVQGAGMFAGGPYACVKHHPLIVCCLGLLPLPINVNDLIVEVVEQSTAENIDFLENIENQNIFIYSAKQDTTITNSVVKKTAEFYNLVGDPNKIMLVELPGQHNFPTDFDAEGHGRCSIPFYPFVANCNYDGAGNMLRHVLGTELNPRNFYPTGRLIEFSQRELYPNPSSIGLGEYGFIYIPEECLNIMHRCKLHVVFHGCQQPVTYPFHWNMHFVRNSGYIHWADTNRIVLAFPQTVSRVLRLGWPPIHPGSMLACWDMFGTYGRDYATKNGEQIKAIRKLINKIVS